MNIFKKHKSIFPEKPVVHYSGRQPGKYSTLSISPFRLAMRLALSIFFCEALVMIILYLLPSFSSFFVVLVDSALLLVLLSPALYNFLFYPLIHHITQRKKAEAVLQRSHGELEQRVEERTQELVKANEQLKQAEEELVRLASFPEQNPDPIIEIDSEDRLTYLNPAAVRRFPEMKASGLPPQMLKDLLSVIAPLRMGEQAAITREIAVGDSVYEQKITYLPEKNLIRVFSRDTTKRKKAEEALRESEERYRSVVSSLNEGVILQEATGKIITWNKSAEKVFGLTEEKALGRMSTGTDWRTVHEDGSDLPGESHPSMITLRTGEPCKDVIIGVKRTEGGVSWISVNTRPLFRKGEENPHAVVISFSDVTDRKRAEEEKKRMEARLQQVHKMEAIGTLAGGIAHDFNNILTTVIVRTEMALLKISEVSPLKTQLEQVLKAGNRAKELVQQILVFSRQSEQERKPFKIGLIIKEAIKLLRASIPSTIEIKQNINTDSDTVLASPTQIHQVLINLCTNAAHAMSNKGGLLEVSLDDIYVTKEAQYPDLKPGPYMMITVKDTGHGMDSSVMGNIFDPFFTTKERGEGTGMGLAVVHGIIKRYDGSITVESEPGKGAVFHVYIPRIEKEPPSEVESVGAIPIGTERVLLVDDEETVIDTVQQMLQDIGYKVVATMDSSEALKTFGEEPDRFDLVITDQTMPQMTGADLAKDLIGIRPDIPIILCTGFSEMINEDKAKAMGIREFVMKPIVMNKMAMTIRSVLD